MSERWFQSARLSGGVAAWEIDRTVVGRLMAWAGRRPAALAEDVEGMARYFPSWLLVGYQGGRAARCALCAAPGVPARGALRCPGCGAELAADRLAWVGELPALARPEPAFERRRAALLAAGFGEAEGPAGAHLLIPLQLSYPAEWPSVEPAVRYAPRWLDAAGLPRSSAGHHIIGVGQACLFAWGQWEAMPVHAVLQQRVVNHAASLLKIMAGVAPAEAFIGRVH